MAEEPARAAIEHLQQAVVEVIGAARAALDVLEEVVSDPHLLTSVAAEASKLVETIAHGIVETAGAAKPEAPSGGVERIRVS